MLAPCHDTDFVCLGIPGPTTSCLIWLLINSIAVAYFIGLLIRLRLSPLPLAASPAVNVADC